MRTGIEAQNLFQRIWLFKQAVRRVLIIRVDTDAEFQPFWLTETH